MSHLLLSHLSKDNNNPELVLNLFNQHAGDTKIIVASRHEETEVYYISQTTPPVVKIKPQQLSMFN
jgi:hypothetical protein